MKKIRIRAFSLESRSGIHPRSLFLLFGLLIWTGQGFAQTQPNLNNPVLLLAYPEQHGEIRDQARLATIVMTSNYGLTLDGNYIIGIRGPENSSLRHTEYNRNKVRVVDVLPGKYKLGVEFTTTGGANAPHSGYKTNEPVFAEKELEAGEVYWLELQVIRFPGRLDARLVLDKNYLKERNKRAIGEFRQNAVFQLPAGEKQNLPN